MLRMSSVFAFALAAVLLAPNTRAAQDTGLKLGEKFEGEMKEKKKYLHWDRSGDVLDHFAAETPIALKAGQKVSITATVIGSDRKVWMALLDPSDKIVAKTGTKQKPPIKTVQ